MLEPQLLWARSSRSCPGLLRRNVPNRTGHANSISTRRLSHTRYTLDQLLKTGVLATLRFFFAKKRLLEVKWECFTR